MLHSTAFLFDLPVDKYHRFPIPGLGNLGVLFVLDTVIIGAGFAGLSAARTLMSEGQENFIILEARDRVGGRTKSGKIGNLSIDLGGMWMSPAQEKLKQLATHYQIPHYPTYLDGNAIFRVGERERRGNREDLAPLLGIVGGSAFLFARWKLERLMALLDITKPWSHPKADWLDATTVETWILQNVYHSLPRAVFRKLCSTLLCAEPSQVSLLFFLHYVKSGGGLEVLISAENGGAQNLVFHGGVHQISRMMADEIGDRVRLNMPVTKIEWNAESVTIDCSCETFTARKAIIAIPPTLMNRIRFKPSLPQSMVTMHDRLFMGSTIKFWVLYEKPFWRAKGLNGTVLLDDAPMTPVMDVTPPGQDQGLLVGFFDGNQAIQYSDMSIKDRRSLVLNMLAENLGPESLTPVDYVDQNWAEEEWSSGCYGAYAPPGVFSRFGESLRKPVGPLHWAGTETSLIWSGYIEGAIRSGERAAREVL